MKATSSAFLRSTQFRIRLATLSTLLLIAGLCSGILYLLVMGAVAIISSLYRTINQVKISYSTLDQISIISLWFCFLIGLIAFAFMAWGAFRSDAVRAKLSPAGRAKGNSRAHEGRIKVWVNKSA
jgi:hypothetical protein